MKVERMRVMAHGLVTRCILMIVSGFQLCIFGMFYCTWFTSSVLSIPYVGLGSLLLLDSITSDITHNILHGSCSMLFDEVKTDRRTFQ